MSTAPSLSRSSATAAAVARRPPVREPPGAQRLVRVNGLADQRVEEVERPCRHEDLGRHEPVGRQLRGRWIQSRQLSGHAHLGLRSEHRQGLRQRNRVRP